MKKSALGFTLVELLVVIAIIAILATIGLVIYSGTQKNARDARRREDVNAIASAIEIKKPANSPTYSPLAASDFSGVLIPQDTSTAKYCIAVSADSTVPAAATGWPATSTCPTLPAGAGYAEVNNTTPAATTVSFRVCALLETGTAPNIYCRANVQ